MTLPVNVAKRLEGTDEGHLMWRGGVTRRGAPEVTVHGDKVNVRRMVWIDQVGPLAPNEYLINQCGEKRCVSPAHCDPKPRKGLRSEECKRGHRYTEESSYIGPDGRRRCNICKRERTYESSSRANAKLRWELEMLSKAADEMKKALDRGKAWTPTARKAATAAGVIETKGA